jgi:hypothetical protein
LQQGNEYFDRPVYLNEMADALPNYLQWSDDVGAVCQQNHLERPATVAISAESCDNRNDRAVV